jgi:hypothetical protein
MDGNLPEWISGGSGRTVPMNKRTIVSVSTHAIMEPMIDVVLYSKVDSVAPGVYLT